METKLNYTLVGLFVILLGAALLSTVLWLTVGGTGKKQYDSYVVYFTESVAGLYLNAPVKYRGVEVGRVASIKLDPDNPERVEIILEIEHGTPIRQDTIAILTTQGLTGLASVELTGGSRQSPPLEAGREHHLPVIQSGPSLVTRLDNALDSVLANFNELSGKLSRLLNDNNQAAFGQTLANLNTVTGAVASRSTPIEQTLANLQTITATFANHSDSLAKALDGSAETLENSAQLSTELMRIAARINTNLAAVEEMTRTITRATKGLETVVQDSRRDLQRVAGDTAPQVNLLLSELRQLTQVVERFGRELERNPRMLLFGRQSSQPGPGE